MREKCKSENLIIGNFYYCNHSDRQWVIKFNGFNTYGNLKGYCCCLEDKYFENSENWGKLNNNTRLATRREIAWLDECIKQDKYVPLESIPLYLEENNYLIY